MNIKKVRQILDPNFIDCFDITSISENNISFFIDTDKVDFGIFQTVPPIRGKISISISIVNKNKKENEKE